MSQTNLQIPQRTQTKLQQFRRRVWQIKLIEGICAAIFGLVVTYLAVFLLDRFFDTPTWMRIILLLTGSVGLGILFPMKCHRWIWRTRKFEQVAGLLKSSMPRLSDRMLGIIELAKSDTEQDRSSALCEAALRQVDDDIKDVSFDDAVPNPKHRQWSAATIIPVALAALLLCLVPAAGWSTAERWLNPFSKTPRYTFAQLKPVDGKLVVPYGESFPVSVELAPSSVFSPKSGSAQIGRQAKVSVPRRQDRFDFMLPAQQEQEELRLSVGDARETVTLFPKHRPELTEIEAEIALPAYLQYKTRLKKDVRAGTLSVVKGSETKLLAKASTEIDHTVWNGQTHHVGAQQFATSAIKLDANKQLELNWTDRDGLTPRRPFQLKVETSDDLPPTVMCSELSREQVVLVNEVLTFEVNADDDFGVREIGIEWQGLRDALTNPVPDKGEAIIIAGSPESTGLTAKATFSPAREEISPQTLQVRLYVNDYLPDRERVYSPPYTLFVLSEQDHANWLAERLKQWSRKAQGIYEREIQLYEENKALRNLPSEQLAQKSTRERLEKQAAAENLNARQLRSVTATGKQMILEAARNDQFNVTTMEGLAEMVSTLEELSKSRMPSVADLLKQAASAKSKSEASKPNSEDKPSAPKVGNNRDPNATSPGDGDEDSPEKAKPEKPVPSIVDVESSMNENEKKSDEDEDEKKKKQPGGGSAKFGLPTTTVYGNTPKAEPSPDLPPMEEVIDDAIDNQEKLLEEFTKVAEELQKILDNLEGSTFVKRLKAASRRQTEVAKDLNKSLTKNFARTVGELTPDQSEATLAVVDRERAEGENISTIKDDLEAYYQRVRQGKFGTVIREMDELNVMTKMNTMCSLVEGNLHGQAIGHAEFWADTFDRWAEQLVGPG